VPTGIRDVSAELHPDPDRFSRLLGPDGELPVGALVAACRREDVQLAVVPDEVVLLCGRDPLAPPRPHWTPWLRRPEVDAEVARATSARWLLSRGLLEISDDETAPPTLRQPLATLSWALASATGLVTYEATVRDGPRETGAILVLPEGLVLHDHIDADLGLHRLVFRSVGTEAAWLAAMLDPDGRSRRVGDPVHAASLEELAVQARSLPGRGRSRSVVVAAAEVDGAQLERSVTTIGTSRGLWTLQARDDATPPAQLQQVGADEVVALAAHLLSLDWTRTT
jgi:hypothetical protein